MYETYDHVAFRELMNDACGGPTLIILSNMILFHFDLMALYNKLYKVKHVSNLP